MLRVMPQSWEREPPRDWVEREAYRIAMEIRRLRDKRDRSAQWLADRTAELGSPITRNVIADIENGRRRYVTTAELSVFAAALETAPIALLFPGPYDEDTAEVIPDVKTTQLWALQWFSGVDEKEPNRALPTDRDQYDRNLKRLRVARQLQELQAAKAEYVQRALGPAEAKAEMERRLGVHIERIIDSITAQIDELKEQLRAEYGG